MTDKTVLDEVRGIVTNVYDYTNADGVVEKKLVIRPDNLENDCFIGAIPDKDFNDFKEGQRVVQVAYSYKRPATQDDIEDYAKMNSECPELIEEFEFITYDEAKYDNEIKKN